MNRREARARSWVHWAALCVALCAILAVWGLWPSEPPWLIVTSLCGAFLALLVTESRHRRDPLPPGPVEDLGGPVEAATVAEFLAAVEARYGNGGAVSGAATRPAAVLWNGEPLPPMLPPVEDMRTAPYPGHDHSGRLGPCPACLYTLRTLAALGEADREAGERVADLPLAADVAAMTAELDTQAREYLAGISGELDAAYQAAVAPFDTGPVCAAEFGQHLCNRRGRHDTHKCECGTVWGQV